MPDLAHFFGLTVTNIDGLSWRQLNHYRARLPDLPPVGAVYTADPKKRT